MIDHITEYQTNGKTHIDVYYTSGRKVQYNMNENWPNTVLEKYLNGTITATYYNGQTKVTRIY